MITATIIVFITGSLILLLYLSYAEVPTGFIAQRQFLGDLYGGTLKPGPHLMIPGSKLFFESTRTHENEFPAEPEKVQKSHKDDPNKKEPFRIPLKGIETAKYYVRDNSNPLGYKLLNWDQYSAHEGMTDKQKEEYSNDPFYSVPLTITVPVVVEWDIDEWSLRTYIQNVGDEETALKRLNDACESIVAELLGPTSAGHANDVRLLLDEEITDRLRVVVGQEPDPITGRLLDKPWGINIRRAYIKPIDPGETINKARSNAGAAASNKVTTITNAEAEKEKRRIEAEGAAQELEILGKKYETEGARFAAKIELARDVLPNTKLMVMDAGQKSSLANLLSLDTAA